MRFSIISSAIVAAVVGFGSTLALLIAAAQALGADQAQTASWVTAICIAKVFETGFLSWRYKMPIVTAWSTAGLALIGASFGFTMNEAVGAFIVCGLMLVATGLIRPMTRLVEKLPASISAGMLGGILLPFALGAAQVANLDPTFVLPLVALFLIVRVFHPALAVIAVLMAGTLYAFLFGTTIGSLELAPSGLVFVRPEFSIAAIVGLALPLYLVTMASQNLPGMSVLRASGYNPPAGPLIAVTGLFSTLSAFLCASTTNLAAITAAICTGPDAHPDPAKRWLTGPVYAACYLVFAIFGASLVGLFAILPPSLIALVAGIALLAPLANATSIALAREDQRIAAMATFAVTASGIVYFGIGAAFWGLVTGLTILGLAVLAGQLKAERT
jgi:benzoate membrane transport protein